MMPIHEIVIYFLGHAIIVLKVRNRWAFVVTSIMEIGNNKLKSSANICHTHSTERALGLELSNSICPVS